MPVQGSKAFQKPASVKFSFYQKRFDKSGTITDDKGNLVYRLRDLGDDHSFGFFKSYPLEIYPAYGDNKVCIIDWDDNPQKTTVTGLLGMPERAPFIAGLMDSDLKWHMPDGSPFEWDGVFGLTFNLLDYRVPQPYSLCPAVVAKYVPRSSKKDYTTLEVHLDALNTYGFLDYLIATVIWLEYKAHSDLQRQESAVAGKKIGQGIGHALFDGSGT